MDDHLAGGPVDLGHPRLSGVEEIDGLGDHRPRVGVLRGELAPPLPELLYPCLQISHGSP